MSSSPTSAFQAVVSRPATSSFEPAPLFEPDDLALLSPEQVTFLEHRQRVMTDELPCKRAGVTVRTLARWLEEPLFLELYAVARETAVNEMEEELRHRAMYGYAQPIVGKDGRYSYVLDPDTGEPRRDANGDPIIVVEQVPQHGLLLESLRARRPEYRQKGELLVGGVAGKPVQQEVKVEYVLPGGLTMDDYRKRWAEEDARHGSAWPEGE